MIFSEKINLKKFFTLLCVLVAALLLCVVLSSCGEVQEIADNRDPIRTALPTETPIPTLDPDYDKPKSGGTVTFAASTALSMNPLFTDSEEIKNIMTLVFDRFIVTGNDGNLYPGIAQSWYCENNVKWHFILRQDVKMTDGTMLCATEVLETLGMIETRGGIYSNIFTNVKRYYADGDYEFVVELKSGDDSFPGKMVFPLLKHSESISFENYVGSGPYKYVKTEDDKMYFTVNSDYWGEKPYFENFVIQLFERENDKYNSDCDVIFISGKNISSYAVKSGYDSYKYRGRTFTCLLPSMARNMEEYDYYTGAYLYVTENITYTAKGRQALYYCINRTKLIGDAVSGNGAPSSWPIVSTELSLFDTQQAYSQDKEKAAELLAEMGYYFDSTGKQWYFDREMKYPVTIHLVALSQNKEYASIAESLKKDFTDMNLSVTIDYTSVKNIANYLKFKTYTFIILSFDSGSISELRQLFSDSGEYNFNAFYNKDIEQLFNLMDMARDDREKQEIYSLLEKKLTEELPLLGLYTKTEAVLVSKNVKGEENGTFGVNNPLESFCSCWFASNNS